MSLATASSSVDMRATATALIARKRLLTFAVPLAILAYFVYIFFAFDILGLRERARLDNAIALVSDTYSYKTHVERNNRRGEIEVAVEGERKGTYDATNYPSWVTVGEDAATIRLDDGGTIEINGDIVRFEVPGFGLIEATQSRADGVTINLDTSDLPDWISYSNTRLSVTTKAARLSLTKARTEVFVYEFGWELFWFTLESPYYGHSFSEIAFGDRIDPTRSNLAGAWQDFWTNAIWRHGDVAWALFETVLMAFLGTFGAAIIALPLAFLAARNFAPLVAIRMAARRLFDFLRGVDGLIWTILLSRAFGPGPMTGALAILFTDTGSFGKLFSEALENVDSKQIEGVASTGAKPLQRYRFGVIPQIVPVLLSQVLYFLESNTRSATIIGAITGGGIGLLLTQAMITQKDWEEVSYYIILIVLLVMAMDSFSGWLRRKLIKGE
ncbi:phosphonate ABC transporter, permease protein PhnE [Celeribacter sp. HF31]|uniref:phosphonate ABC transporter, permease protein PhnE n=1 Tax=Celeribacter sp. HF31 TaxID=2721558 RepID=UPI00143155D3|nr:phosphonate ABC transporter, permease protein PhnE [Celeribacter sp. HF31]NIY79787.1 phosphonate ABC transporter, permease protein PhnE [Celeribacter sp. HF31]